MSQQEWLQEPKASMYDQLLAVDGVTEVEMFDFQDTRFGVYVKGGSDIDIADAMSMHTYSWHCARVLGDTSVKKSSLQLGSIGIIIRSSVNLRS